MAGKGVGREERYMPKLTASERCEPFQEWLEGVENERTKRYIQERAIKQMDWYRTKCYACKVSYQRWMTVSIILSGVIPGASIFADGGIVAKVLSRGHGLPCGIQQSHKLMPFILAVRFVGMTV